MAIDPSRPTFESPHILPAHPAHQAAVGQEKSLVSMHHVICSGVCDVILGSTAHLCQMQARGACAVAVVHRHIDLCSKMQGMSNTRISHKAHE